MVAMHRGITQIDLLGMEKRRLKRALNATEGKLIDVVARQTDVGESRM